MFILSRVLHVCETWSLTFTVLSLSLSEVGLDTVWFGRGLPIFLRNLTPPPSYDYRATFYHHQQVMWLRQHDCLKCEQTTWLNISEHNNLWSHHCENLKLDRTISWQERETVWRSLYQADYLNQYLVAKHQWIFVFIYHCTTLDLLEHPWIICWPY
jgi:hypothetical protein